MLRALRYTVYVWSCRVTDEYVSLGIVMIRTCGLHVCNIETVVCLQLLATKENITNHCDHLVRGRVYEYVWIMSCMHFACKTFDY